jgi:succinate dehydrogenase / fumarate reductase, membrane anchor subunit
VSADLSPKPAGQTTAPTDTIGDVDEFNLYDVDNPAPLIEAPRTRTSRTPKASRGNFEMQAWLFMRLSGIVLVVLVLGHLLIQLVLDGGVTKIGFAFVAGRWASPFWQGWDLLMLWLAMLHGANGLRTIINDYAERDNTRSPSCWARW